VTSFVLDASVAAKWFLPPSREPYALEAERVLEHYVAGKCSLTVPDLFWPELGNILSKSARRGEISLSSCGLAVEHLELLRLPTLPSEPLLARALTIALDFQRPFYDCEYVALAVESRTPLLTADERLVNALGAHFPVQWLGSVSF
jgi:predicted nucleic acid-binding protein